MITVKNSVIAVLTVIVVTMLATTPSKSESFNTLSVNGSIIVTGGNNLSYEGVDELSSEELEALHILSYDYTISIR